MHWRFIVTKYKRKLFVLALLLIIYASYRILFRTPDTASELPRLIVQKGNDHYFKDNKPFGSNAIQPRKSKYEWKELKKSLVKSTDPFGKLNVHIWDEICGKDLKSLKNHVLFPRLPSRRFYTKTTSFSHGKGHKCLGERIFGLLHPKETGLYTFRVQGFSVEVWMSKNPNPNFSALIAKRQPHSKETSRPYDVFEVDMVHGNKYYVEILHKVEYENHVFDLQWKVPGSSRYSEIHGTDLSLMLLDGYLRNGEVDSDKPILEIQPIHAKNLFPVLSEREKARANLHHLPLLADVVLEDIFPHCEYKPSYLVDFVVPEYKGVWETHYDSLYPVDDTNVTYNGWTCLGNDALEKEKAVGITQLFMAALNKKKPGKYKLEHVLSVEENHDKIKGDRYLLELEVREVEIGRNYRVSKFVYKRKGENSLCIPQGYQWKQNATVNIVITVGGRQGRWVQHFIDNMAEIYRETKDEYFNVVIMDFHSKDIDIQASLEKSGLPRYILLRMESKFQKTIGLQYAMSAVTYPDDIVFVCDLHLYLPVNSVDHIRKHCIQGKTLFNPLLVRLNCGFTAMDPDGRWEHDGFGPIAAYKSDWDTFGGMNVERFKYSWGGEDWEMLDRILTSGYEVDRIKLLNFFHFYHTKKGMWQESEQ